MRASLQKKHNSQAVPQMTGTVSVSKVTMFSRMFLSKPFAHSSSLTCMTSCYNNCPGDDGQFGAQQTMTANCNAAKAYGTSTSSTASSSVTAQASSSASSETASESSPTLTGTATSGHSFSTFTASGAMKTSSDSAAAPASGAIAQGGLFAALALGLGLIL